MFEVSIQVSPTCKLPESTMLNMISDLFLTHIALELFLLQEFQKYKSEKKWGAPFTPLIVVSA